MYLHEAKELMERGYRNLFVTFDSKHFFPYKDTLTETFYKV